MKQKTEKAYIYEGLGFPVELSDVKMVYINDEWCPVIDVVHVARKEIEKLVTQDSSFTGNQVRFIRSYLNMSLREFAVSIANVTHTSISKWEKHHDQFARIDPNTELVIRLELYKRFGLDGTLDEMYSQLKMLTFYTTGGSVQEDNLPKVASKRTDYVSSKPKQKKKSPKFSKQADISESQAKRMSKKTNPKIQKS